MKEQVITPRAGRSTVVGKTRSTDIVQRPARRYGRGQGRGTQKSGPLTLRKALTFVPLAGKVLLAACLGVLVFAGYRAAASAAFFQMRTIDVSGTARVSSDEIKTIVRRTVAPTGVWSANLSQISAELERQPWVHTAIVSRVLPSGMRVRLTERVPRVVVRTSNGRFMWVDEDGVMLGAVSPSDHMPTFFIRGWDETGTDAARVSNRERLQKYLEMAREWETLNLAGRVSEVNLNDLRDVRAQLAGSDAQVEVRLGHEDFGKRLSRALKVLDDVRHSPRGTVTRLDATQSGRVVIGFSSGAQSSGEKAGASGSPSEANAKANAHDQEAKSTAGDKSDAQERRDTPRKGKEQQKQDDDRASGERPSAPTRPRRAGRDG